MNWITRPPTAPGYYWCDDKGQFDVREIYEFDGLRVRGGNWAMNPVASLSVRWSDTPIPLPEEEEHDPRCCAKHNNCSAGANHEGDCYLE